MTEFLKEYVLDDIKNVTSLRYEDLSKWNVGEAVIKEAINRWERVGFLNDIKDVVKKEIIAVAFDNMSHDLLTENERVINLKKRYEFNCMPDDETKIGVNFDVIVFPILRRVICKVDNFNYDEFLTCLEKFSFLAINYDGCDFMGKCDIEEEFCTLLSLIIENYFNNKKNKK